jgi:hypothetical protein
VSDRQVGQSAVLKEFCCAAVRHTAKQLQDLEPEHRDERLGTGIRQVGTPAFPAAAEDAVIVDADDGPDGDAFGAL